MKVLYDGKEIGNIVTNRSLSIPEALNLIGIDPNEEEGSEPKYDYSLFELDYSSEYAAQLGRKGGSVKSDRKAKTSAENGKKVSRGQKFTIRSKFHPTSINIVAELDTLLSDSQVRRIDKALCGMRDCTCGGINWAEVDGDYQLVKDHEMRGGYDTDVYMITAGH